MKFSHFFIDRPIFAMALSILVVLAGGVAYLTLPEKQSPNLLMVVNLVSPDGTYRPEYVSNYALTQVKDPLSRLYGVGNVQIFGERDSFAAPPGAGTASGAGQSSSAVNDQNTWKICR